MCGIGGYHVLEGGTVPEEAEVLDLLANLQERGKDASGLGWIDRGQHKLIYLKDDIPSDKLADKIAKFKVRPWGANIPQAMMLHARASTSGSPKKMKNNHPVLFTTKQVCVGVTHNGIIGNPEEVFRELTLKKETEVDSEAIGAALAVGLETSTDWARAVGALQKLRGSAAFAAMSPERPDMLVARASSSPLTLIYEDTRKIVWWASETWMIPVYTVSEFFGVKWSRAPHTYHMAEGEGFVLSRNAISTIAVPKLEITRKWTGRGGGNGYTGPYTPPYTPPATNEVPLLPKGVQSSVGLFCPYGHPATEAWKTITRAADMILKSGQKQSS